MINPEVLVKLIDRLDTYPVGLPDAPEPREFLNSFLTPDEARLALVFPFKEGTASGPAGFSGWDLAKAESALNSMAEKGAVFDYRLGEGSVYWLLAPSVAGFIEFSLIKLRRDLPMEKLAGLLEAYESGAFYKEVFGSKTRISRALVSMDAPVSSQIMTTGEVESLIRKAGGGSRVKFCGHKALSLEPRQKPPGTPENEAIKYLRIAYEKGKLPAMARQILKSRFS